MSSITTIPKINLPSTNNTQEQIVVIDTTINLVDSPITEVSRTRQQNEKIADILKKGLEQIKKTNDIKSK